MYKNLLKVSTCMDALNKFILSKCDFDIILDIFSRVPILLLNMQFYHSDTFVC